MDGFQEVAQIESWLSTESFGDFGLGEGLLRARPARIAVRRYDDAEALVVTKTIAGFDATCVAHIGEILADAAAGRLGPLKFLVFDFAHSGEGDPPAAEGFSELVVQAANLILSAPVVTIAAARAHLVGADMEFALACSMMIADAGARFSFAADPLQSMGAYGLLSQKIGFVRAEMLMEGSHVLDPSSMRELMLLKDVAEPGAPGIEAFLRRAARRHNASVGIYRAQRIAAPVTAIPA